VVAIARSLVLASLRAQMEYRSQFVTAVIMGVVFQGTGLAFIWVILNRFDALAGWTLGEVAFLYALRVLAHALYGTLFNGTARVYGMVRRGEFDRYLVRPVPPLALVMFERLHVSGLGDLLGGVAMLAIAARLVPVDWSPLAVGYLALALVGGCFVEAAIRLAGASFAFRVQGIDSLNFLLDQLFGTFGSYPLGIYSAVVRAALTFVLPVAFVAYFPASVLLGRTGELAIPPLLAYCAPVVGFGLFALAYRLWSYQLWYYQSAGH
jgi:ABC-2 type transport system permease protein